MCEEGHIKIVCEANSKTQTFPWVLPWLPLHLFHCVKNTLGCCMRSAVCVGAELQFPGCAGLLWLCCALHIHLQ